MGCGVWGVGKIEAIQRLHAGVSPTRALHQDREFGVSHWITIAPKPDLTVPSQLRQLLIFPSWEGLGVGYPFALTPHPTPRKAFKAVCHPVSLGWL